MKVVVLDSFIKDVERIGDRNLTTRLDALLDEINDAGTTHQILNLKKLKGAKAYFRIRVGHYRVGIRVRDDAVFVHRCLPRKDFYRSFP